MGDGFGKLFLLFLAIAIIFLGASTKGYAIMQILFAKTSTTPAPTTSTTPTTPGKSSGGSSWGTVPSSNPTDLKNTIA